MARGASLRQESVLFYLEMLHQTPDRVGIPREEATAKTRLNIRPCNLRATPSIVEGHVSASH